MTDSALILFTLAPEAEGVRKRLGGPVRTRRIFSALIGHLQSVCDEVPELDLLVASPRPTSLLGGRHLLQRGRDFGESLRLAVEDAFALGYRRVLVVGNDTPEISPDYLSKALDRLGAGDASPAAENAPRAVLGPTRDGGYALLGLSRPCSAAFSGIRFGSTGVAAATVQRLEKAGFDLFRLQVLEDIDDPRSLQRVLGRLRLELGSTLFPNLFSRLRHLMAPLLLTDGFAGMAAIRVTPRRALRLRGPPRRC